MSLKKKIILSFFISAFLIAILATFEYVNFVRIKKEIQFLELTDTVRSKSLQLRRHEKNFFLYGPFKAEDESREIYRYLGELDELLASPFPENRTAALPALRDQVREYRRAFGAIEKLLGRLLRDLERTKVYHQSSIPFYPLIESSFYERPSQAADFLRKVFRFPARHPLVTGLGELDREITGLRKTGEDIIAFAKDLDRSARENVETGIRISQAAILIIFPVFLASGLAMLFFISRNVVNRLGFLIDVVDKTGKGTFAHVEAPSATWGRDEVGVLIRKFDQMELQLAHREKELDRKNNELMQVKKLAAIGTLASGVAHELNNPLNNISLSAQILAKEAGEKCPVPIQEAVNDIIGQTARVKRIVGDLLEYARGRELQVGEVELNELITNSYKHLAVSQNVEKIRFSLDSGPAKIIIQADPAQLEQVFINLFTNSVDAMQGEGDLRVQVREREGATMITVTDSGKGIPRESLEKIFEPFFTTKDKGTGLGLAIVFNIIRKHNGDITVESEEGKGTTFTIALPKN